MLCWYCSILSEAKPDLLGYAQMSSVLLATGMLLMVGGGELKKRCPEWFEAAAEVEHIEKEDQA